MDDKLQNRNRPLLFVSTLFSLFFLTCGPNRPTQMFIIFIGLFRFRSGGEMLLSPTTFYLPLNLKNPPVFNYFF